MVIVKRALGCCTNIVIADLRCILNVQYTKWVFHVVFALLNVRYVTRTDHGNRTCARASLLRA